MLFAVSSLIFSGSSARLVRDIQISAKQRARATRCGGQLLVGMTGGATNPRGDRGPTADSRSFRSRSFRDKNVHNAGMREPKGDIPPPGRRRVLNNAIWRRGVATLCVLCRAYHYHIRLHFEPSRTPALSPASCPPAPWVFPSRERGRSFAYIAANRMLIGKY